MSPLVTAIVRKKGRIMKMEMQEIQASVGYEVWRKGLNLV
jgi:hypothetical protein